MNNFKAFATAIAAHFAVMSRQELFRTNSVGDDLWAGYLAAFPEGTNPIFRTRTEHDGSYDKNFVRQLGNVVCLGEDGEFISIWDAPGLVFPYNIVAARLSEMVKFQDINGLFRTKEPFAGHLPNIERREDGSTHEWEHFYTLIAAKHKTTDVGTVVGEHNTTCAVIRRGFTEITPDAVASVLDLIESGALYRGTEFKTALEGFRTSQNRFLLADDERQRQIVVLKSYGSAGARLRNSAIGTLLTDLSEGVDLERAVKSFEAKVAPTNYKRPTALITKGMIDQATKTIADLGLEPALERRHAKISDITINNVLWADSSVQPQMKGGLSEMLMKEVKPSSLVSLRNIPVTVADFIEDILPNAHSMEVFFSGGLQNNLMSLTAPVHEDIISLFKWPNSFAWSYNGNITDSIKEKVKAAGGNISAKLRVSLAWYNHDDLDLHAQCPDGHVYYASKTGNRDYYRMGAGTNGQILDVDMNAGGGQTRTPVENLSWVNPKDGHYKIQVHQFSKRETSNVGFTIEVEIAGTVNQYSYQKGVTGMIDVCSFNMRNGIMSDFEVDDKTIIGQGISQEKWGLQTEQFIKVNTVLLSPNFWDGRAIGNKHWFFILDKCQNDEATRGIYNEFLAAGLEQHRKVFEVLGNKTKCLPATEQLSGLGFSSTKRDSVIIKVTDSKSTKTYSVNF